MALGVLATSLAATVGEGGGNDFSGLSLLREAGVCSIALLELSTSPHRVLIVADSVAYEIATETIELLRATSPATASCARSPP